MTIHKFSRLLAAAVVLLLLPLRPAAWPGAADEALAQEEDTAASSVPNAGKPDAATGEEEPHAGEDGEHAGGVNPLKSDPDLAIFTAIVFFLLLGILGKFAWGPIIMALDRREQDIADNIAAAQRQNEEAKGLLAEHQAKLAAAAGEVRQLLEEARRDAEHTKTQIVAEAKAAAQAEQERALREVRNATDGALKQLAETSANMAVELAGKIIEEKLSADDHSRLIRDAVSRFQTATPSNN